MVVTASDPDQDKCQLELLNTCIGGSITAGRKVYPYDDSIKNPEDYEPSYPVELFYGISSTASLPGHRLFLNKGYIILSRGALQAYRVNMNGARCIFKSMKYNVLFRLAATGNHRESQLTLPRTPCTPGADKYSVERF